MARDVIVVGGGVVGLSTAYHLVRGGARTLLVDNGRGGRATDAGAGILSAIPASATDPYDRFLAQAVRAYPALIEQLAAEGAGDTGYGVCGALTVAVSDDELAPFEQVRTSLRGLPDYTLLSPERARELFPPLARVQRALHCPHDARLDGRLLAAALRCVACAHGLEIREAEVSDLAIGQGAVRSVRVGGDELGAGHIVIAAGAWSTALGARIGVRVPVEPQRGQIIHLDLPDTDTSGWPLVRGFRDHYMVPWPGRLVVGATRERVGFAPRTTLAGVMEVLSEAARVAPGLEGAGVAEIRVGLRPATPDGLPILGPVPGLANAWLATGHGAVGLQLGPYSGQLIAEGIMRGEAATEIAMFGVERFLRP